METNGNQLTYTPTPKDLEEMADIFAEMDSAAIAQGIKNNLRAIIDAEHPSDTLYQQGFRDGLRHVIAMLDIRFGLNPYRWDGME